jgi:hypothetical protein
MVNPEHLVARGLRAYEVGRFVTASRIALLLIPIAALCLLESEGREACACLAVVLLGSAVWLRWRNREGMDSVTTGLLAGALPLGAGLLLARFDLRCGLAGGETYCTVFSVLIGALAGIVIALRENRWRRRLTSLVTAGAIASLAAGLGCIRLGVWGVASMVVGIAVGSMLGIAIFKRSES